MAARIKMKHSVIRVSRAWLVAGTLKIWELHRKRNKIKFIALHYPLWQSWRRTFAFSDGIPWGARRIFNNIITDLWAWSMEMGFQCRFYTRSAHHTATHISASRVGDTRKSIDKTKRKICSRCVSKQINEKAKADEWKWQKLCRTHHTQFVCC